MSRLGIGVSLPNYREHIIVGHWCVISQVIVMDGHWCSIIAK